MKPDDIASRINAVLTKSPVLIRCICMHEYSICVHLYELSIQIETELEIEWNDGTAILVNADYRHRTEQSFSILRLIGRKVLRCRFDDEMSLVLETSGGESVRCIAVEPVESYTVSGIADYPLCLPYDSP